MKFRDWLLKEEDSGDQGHGQGGGAPNAGKFTGGTFGGPFWDLLYPTSPGDYQWASTIPLEHFWLQWKLRRGEELGRTLHNVDNQEFQKRTYTTIESPTAPDGGDGFWKHKEDDNSPSTKVVKGQDLVWIGDGKTSKDTKPISGYNFGSSPFGPHEFRPFYADTEKYLRDIFHDEASGKWPDISDDFDEPWTKKYESVLNEGDFLGTGFHLYPTIAPDWTRSTDSAKQIKLVRDRWEKEDRENRLSFKNINLDDFKKLPFKAVSSKSLPEVGDGFWKHKEDDWEESSVKVSEIDDLENYGVAKKADQKLSLEKSQQTSHPFGDQSVEPPNYKLSQVFGDNPPQRGPTLPDDFDEPWIKRYESYLAEYGGGGGAATSAMHGGIQDMPGSTVNYNMPVKSKIMATSPTKENEPEKDPDEMFGIRGRKRRKERRRNYIDTRRKAGVPMDIPRVYT